MVYRKTASRRRHRRWYATAKTPFGSFTAGNQPVGRMTKRSLQTTIKRVARSIEEPKEIYQNYLGTFLRHSTLYTINPFANIVQGTTDSTRIGDDIKITKGIRGRFRYVCSRASLPAGVLNSYARLLFVSSDKEFTPSTTFWGSGLGSTDLFFLSSTPEISLVDNNLAHVLYEKTFPLCSTDGTVGATGQLEREFDFFIPFAKHLTWQATGGSAGYFKGRNYYFVLVCNCPGGTIGSTTLIESSNLQFRIAWTDGR